MIVDVNKLKEVAEVEFGYIVKDVIIIDINELRVILRDGSFLDIWFSLKLKKTF